MHEGHRQRMLERLKDHAESLQEHELLEILLFNAIPRKNTNFIAHDLLNAFGSIEAVFSADIDQLTTVEGVGESTAAYLRCIGLFYDRVKFGKVTFPNRFSASAFSEYLRGRYEGLISEVMEIYCMDCHDQVTYSKRFTIGNRDGVKVQPEEISKVLVSQRPSAIVLAHNHVGCSARPSEKDDHFTAQIETLCSIHNICLYDHIIMGEDDYYSYFLTGRLDEIREKFHITRILKGLV